MSSGAKARLLWSLLRPCVGYLWWLVLECRWASWLLDWKSFCSRNSGQQGSLPAPSLSVSAYLQENDLSQGTFELTIDINGDSSRAYHLRHALEKWLPLTYIIRWLPLSHTSVPLCLSVLNPCLGTLQPPWHLILLSFGFNCPSYSLKWLLKPIIYL